jgi:tetratricopeptide (TPR) repeat protein
MSVGQVFSLDAVRTDGWFERIGEGIGSFQALCEIVGERFFAFSMITGARITAVTVDRRNPDNTLVDFAVGVGTPDDLPAETQRLTLADFRRRLVGALLTDEMSAPIPTRETDLEGIQLYIGVRYLLLAPLYGYSLRQLEVSEQGSEVTLVRDGLEEKYDLETFRMRVRAHVRDELERIASGNRGAIDLGRVAEAEAASLEGDDSRVLSLLGAWPAPLAIFLRTPEGQMLAPEPRALIAKGLGLLGTACVRLGDVPQGEEIFRLGIQYAQDGVAAADIFQRLGEALMNDQRAAEAIGPLRRAVALGGNPRVLWPQLGRAFYQRGRYVAAFASIREALACGAPEADLAEELRQLEGALGPKLTAWRAVVATLATATTTPPPPDLKS